MNHSKYDGLVEVVVGTMITFRGKVLLVQSLKWGDHWLFPGGHVEYGEPVFRAAEREALEETGLPTKAQYVINFGENIFVHNFHRPAHMMFYHVVCEAASDQLRLDEHEVKQAIWFTADEALQCKLTGHVQTSIQRWKDGVRLEISTQLGEGPRR